MHVIFSLTRIRYFTQKDVYMQETIMVQKLTYLILNTVLCCYLNDPQLCFLFSDSCSRVPCLSLNGQLFFRKKSSDPTNSLVFQHICVFEHFPTMTMILRSIFLHRGLRDSNATVTEGSNAHWWLGLGIKNVLRYQNRILKVRNRILVVK